jgi:hypothetical protein
LFSYDPQGIVGLAPAKPEFIEPMQIEEVPELPAASLGMK